MELCTLPTDDLPVRISPITWRLACGGIVCTSIPIDQFIARKYARYQMMITLSIQGPITWLIACVVELPVKIPDMQL